MKIQLYSFYILQVFIRMELFRAAIKSDDQMLGEIASERSLTGMVSKEQKKTLQKFLLNNRQKCRPISFVEYVENDGSNIVPIQNLLCFGSC